MVGTYFAFLAFSLFILCYYFSLVFSECSFKKKPINSVVSTEVKRKEGWRAIVKELERVGGEEVKEGLMARNWVDLLPAKKSCGIARTQVGHSEFLIHSPAQGLSSTHFLCRCQGYQDSGWLGY